MLPYRGRFAPSPTGPLHMGSLVAAMASYLDARAHAGIWLLRIEDLDFERSVKGADREIIQSLQRCGMQWDEEIIWQSARTIHYQDALDKLKPWVFPCACSRKEIADSRVRMGLSNAQIYPGTCRNGIQNGVTAKAFRLRVPDGKASEIHFHDRLLGFQWQDLSAEVGDFVLKRADGFWAYQLGVVVDDAEQRITHIVRGSDLLDSTARQIYLQSLLGYSTPFYLHIPVVNNADGEKLSKQTGALAFDKGSKDLLNDALCPAAEFLNLRLSTKPTSITQFWEYATDAWKQKFFTDQGQSRPQ
ncbi:tRNA glutamyl-Q(34) synthetase GluQRS [Undibacterium fentianense]|uniref:Glutamyl-Q tRNA(Asp) synthetase n=1 Tax=Undibacterium fentianense TaxID=2828728 RepID=A0A941DY36_9BURK|nr:tRNA glutamyl-Q(34) synthetase GluQRS [Undibacterium fentianense]MBR7799569.1 tRNA glutamyl-Q(34) synthetase GluQRS [Undibacterium fentianense]